MNGFPVFVVALCLLVFRQDDKTVVSSERKYGGAAPRMVSKGQTSEDHLLVSAQVARW